MEDIEHSYWGSGLRYPSYTRLIDRVRQLPKGRVNELDKLTGEMANNLTLPEGDA